MSNKPIYIRYKANGRVHKVRVLYRNAEKLIASLSMSPNITEVTVCGL